MGEKELPLTELSTEVLVKEAFQARQRYVDIEEILKSRKALHDEALQRVQDLEPKVAGMIKASPPSGYTHTGH